METLLYFGKVNLYWILFYACYWLFFRKHTFFLWNRGYLIGSLLISFLIPVISIPETEKAMPEVLYTVNAAVSTPILISATYPVQETFNWITLLWVLPATGSLWMLFKLIKSFHDLRQILKSGESLHFPDYELILLTDNKTGSFSFLKWLVLNRYDYENNPEPILRHEMVHIRQLHSLDILLIESLKIFFWFNPVIWFYKISLQEVHEFLADEAAPNRDHYARFLVSYSLSVPVTLLTNHFFNSSILKSRIKMIYKNRNSRWSLGKYLMIVPVLLFAMLMTAARTKLKAPKELATPINNLLTEKNIVQENGDLPALAVNQKVLKADTGKVKIDIEGDILRESGLGIPNVNVFDPQTNLTVTTDPLGHFKMTGVFVGNVLVASHVSFTPQIFAVEKNKFNYALTFKNSQNEIKGPIFTAYQNVVTLDEERKRKKEITESLASVKELKPQFPGGDEALAKYIQTNIRYPEEALNVSAGGIALVSFTINSNGDVRKPKLVKEIGWGIDDEALRLVLNMPRWEPARQNGRAVSMEYTLSIRFDLKREVVVKEKYQGSYPAWNQSDKKHYFNYKIPDVPVIAGQENPLKRDFGFSNGKKPDVKVSRNQLKFYKLTQKYPTENSYNFGLKY